MKFYTLVSAVCLGSAALNLPVTSASAVTMTFGAVLSAANENPPTASSGTGFAEVTIDTVLQTMRVDLSFSGLTSPNTAAHIHCCVAPNGNTGVATTTPTFTHFPSGT